MIRIKGGIQNYAWGKVGKASFVSQFIEEVAEEPYAEYWLGTHPTAPSQTESGELSAVAGNLHYLMKVLSIQKPLSIQIHPSRAQAEQLHSQYPELYKDPNHKPELCMAVTKMRLLYGLKSHSEVTEMLESVPELAELVGEAQSLHDHLTKLFEDPDKSHAALARFLARLQPDEYPLVHELHRHFPGDIGIFMSMYMHYIELEPFKAVFIHPGYPHCYLEGDCIEVMACSDNVVRAGLTPKHKDVQTLLEIMDYACAEPPQILDLMPVDQAVAEFPAPYPDFKLARVTKETIFQERGVGLVLQGSVVAEDVQLEAGQCFYLCRPIHLVPHPSFDLFICSSNRHV